VLCSVARSVLFPFDKSIQLFVYKEGMSVGLVAVLLALGAARIIRKKFSHTCGSGSHTGEPGRRVLCCNCNGHYY